MKSLADGLPPDIARQIHPDWRKNEADYWAVREEMLAQYRDQWIAYADGAILVHGTDPIAVYVHAQQSERHPYVTCVGQEDEPWSMRRMSFPYDTTYPRVALPSIPVEFRTVAGSAGTLLNRDILDTGADSSALPWSDCQALQLDLTSGLPSAIGGVGGSRFSTVVFLVWVHLDGQEFPCRVQADFSGQERILGRDVLNRLDVLFRGPAAEIIINP